MSRRAHGQRVAEDLIDEADDARVFGGFVEIAVVLTIISDDLEAFFLFEEVEGVRTDAEVFLDLPLEGGARGEHRPQLEVRERFQTVQPRRGEESAERDLDMAVGLTQRQHFLSQQDARGEPGENVAVGLDVFERGVFQTVLAGEPAEDFLLALGRGAVQARECLGVEGGELTALDHARGEFGERGGGHGKDEG